MSKDIHLAQGGVALCGASHLLAHSTTIEVFKCDCMKCLVSMLGQLLAQADVTANHLRVVAERKADFRMHAPVDVKS